MRQGSQRVAGAVCSVLRGQADGIQGQKFVVREKQLIILTYIPYSPVVAQVGSC